jgi:CBS domain-containing protein
MSAGKICVRSVDTAAADESVQVAAERMAARNVGSLIVLDNLAQRPIGIVTDRDLAIKVVARGRNPYQTTVREVMSAQMQTIDEAISLEDALAVMRRGPYRRLPVVNEGGALVGVLSLDDILALLAEEFGQIGRLLEQENPSALVEA